MYIKKKIRAVGESQNNPFEKPLHDIYKEIYCLAPIKSLSFHISRSVPAIDEDWVSLWKNNFKLYKDVIQQ